MNRLIRIMSFVLPFFCLLMSVSYAEFSSGVWLNVVTSATRTQHKETVIDNYTYAQIYNIIKNYYADQATYKSSYDNLITAINNNNYDYVITHNYYTNDVYQIFIFKNLEVGHWVNSDNYLCFTGKNEGSNILMNPDNQNGYGEKLTDFSYVFGAKFLGTLSIEYSTVPIKELTRSSSQAFWDGSSYFYEIPGAEEPDTPSLPSNADIAKAVQAFYNSDYYKNNKDFTDFMVMYNYETQYFSFIGHNFGIDLGQVIVPSGYEYEGYSYDQDWWKFFLRNISSQVASNLWNRYYWLYSTNDFGENFTYDGKGYINSIINIHWATSSIIVYSTTDYPVVKIELDENGALTPVEGTVPGDQYTYDETLDPTTSDYNPLENFLPVNPEESILGDIDLNEINKVFEENKDILNIEKAGWIFTANNQLTGYFIGFLSLLIVFLIISRILGG